MVLKKGKSSFTTSDPVQIAAFQNNGYTEVKSRGTQQAKPESAEPEAGESSIGAESEGDTLDG
jgi:hypothetical protein